MFKISRAIANQKKRKKKKEFLPIILKKLNYKFCIDELDDL